MVGLLFFGLRSSLNESVALLYSVCQVGLLLFMFMVGLELNTKKLHELGRVAIFFCGCHDAQRKGFRRRLEEQISPAGCVLLIPLFFAFTGLRTSLGLISGTTMIVYCGLLFIIAVAGQFGASMIAARVIEIPWREAAAVGILMNTRGLIELVILNIGLEIGVLTRPLFSMMVLMAIGTTLMTTPLLSLINSRPSEAP